MLIAHLSDPHIRTGPLAAEPAAGLHHALARVVALDSRRPDSPAGLLGAEQLAWLDGVLTERPDVPAVVCLHHPPLAVGIPFLDGIRLDDGPALADVVARHPRVVRVLAGHVHRTVVAPFAGSLVATAPSTYRQTALRMHDDRPPGYLAEPTGFLLHQSTETGWVTHLVAASHAGPVLGM
ncbi:hypothetical protein [Phytomonospora endophytica]|uniref:3',5'-cyclic AMP phosphodiesterase CpdA n=1 Tax=Phytomonospora endophytica TaxID=714109 RepID=A0A841FLE5_9ACTN|nr:hypothetical protein [Phytomonospora endophytica]MBB6036775.1 3',5'-cyclic AMP phosphodiesterase CpdA [Phytomonospora endophytica]GIG68191.1 hypothetical protein Pen01_44860 [Phytomonospora endophytica]